jgi:hypothetical protein
MTNRRHFTRRELLKLGAAGAAIGSLSACATMGGSKGKVVVIGGGYGGATAAKYTRLWSDGSIDVTLVEPQEAFVSCPLSNLVLGGSKTIADITVPYSGLAKYGVRVLRDTATAIDTSKKQVRLASGTTLDYDRLVVSPGIEFMWDNVRGMSAAAAEQIPHAWKAGPQTLLLRRQLEAMRDGGVVVMSHPLSPYRCPPGPYERACQIAFYLKTRKPKSKLIMLDANPDYVSKKPLFSRVFAEDYKGIVEYRPGQAVTEVDVAGRTFVLELGEKIRGDAAARRQYRARCGTDHREQPLVRGRLDHAGVDQGARRARARRRDAVGARDAEVRPHGQPARQGRGRGDRGTAQRAHAGAADDGQHLLQLHRRPECRARRQRASLEPGEEDHGIDRSFGGHLLAGPLHLGARGSVRQRLGADHLGRHAGLRTTRESSRGTAPQGAVFFSRRLCISVSA